VTTIDVAPTRPAPLTPEVLADICAGVAAAEAWWRPHAHHDPAGRRPVRLLATDVYEVWVIGWTTGQGVELHDHGDAAGALVVVEGGLAELTYEPGTGALAHRAIAPGVVHPLPEGLVHDVVAAAPVPTTSIHVYSPPLETMRRWDPVTLEPDADEAVLPDPPVLGGEELGRALHPSAARRG
jgi:predicted metal-dependent enzyme (double-stranded beta helix superfamily)